MKGSMRQMRRPSLPPINENIRAHRVQLITHDGTNMGVVPIEQALEYARLVGLDLVVITDKGPEGVPITKVMDYGKSQYEKKKKQTEARKTQQTIQVKEVKFRPGIGEHDYQTKFKRIVDFLNDGKRVKVSLFFRGRENINRVERGGTFFKRVTSTFDTLGLTDQLIIDQEGRVGQNWFRVYYIKSSK